MTDSMMTVLVCGGRDYADYARIARLLDFNRAKIAMIVHGGATGADTLAGRWAAENDVPCLRVPAGWKKFGKKAGFIRNEKMLALGKPGIVVAFPGGVGTAMMIQLARKAGVRVIEVDAPKPAPVQAQPKKAKLDDPGLIPSRWNKYPARPEKDGRPVIQPSRDQLIDRNIAAGLAG
jgi:hypothetical protein